MPTQEAKPKKKRTSDLDAVIKSAKKNAKDGSDYHSVWNVLRNMALEEETPFTGITDGTKGLQYTNDKDSLTWFSKEALRKRMNPSAR